MSKKEEANLCLNRKSRFVRHHLFFLFLAVSNLFEFHRFYDLQRRMVMRWSPRKSGEVSGMAMDLWTLGVLNDSRSKERLDRRTIGRPICWFERAFGLNEKDFYLHGIYMDHEPKNEFVSTLDKCKDAFLNILLNGANLQSASMSNEMRVQFYHTNDWESDKEVEELVKNDLQSS
ncbi:unnamed protein product [Lactuca saligna]|uniref:Uncharacterized protein n=1 Tax=Lactuca saligna TaxID=75948 RepID=A0AA35Z867_LACSI|nr:unnamed protein product [Lactuca saligna]